MSDQQSNERGRSVVLVGHCRPDAWMLSSMLRRAAPGHRVEMAGSDKELHEHLDDADLLVVNRVLDGAFPDESGIALIQRLGEDSKAPMILISNFENAQDAAVEAGAARGFGKRELNSPHAAALVRAALGVGHDAPS